MLAPEQKNLFKEHSIINQTVRFLRAIGLVLERKTEMTDDMKHRFICEPNEEYKDALVDYVTKMCKVSQRLFFLFLIFIFIHVFIYFL